ncbi:NAD dependent epimerase/dehydratase [Flavobacterium noncentrifugens]|uniref:Nucleoside-diphosphate-sugar epimerase n=1 Tax=Flavobacterium noncentrifugens TaxID=1128970 RepID=A0A1G8UR05_9FLAO|nr:SDR family oxidoreductase [Flavobacterium noncentrifugens]GEP52607.1 NAD dependent epimerase/dehydratase [Flavobacterium noncentrifugens]SDJ56179.1 Nucleoside-diphosphate-sugar epimerase [Flavobacterium noncentrifugens]
MKTQETQNTKHIALVVGSTGMAGSNLAAKLIQTGWEVYGLSRSAKNDSKGVTSIAADLLDPEQLTEALKNISPTHVFFTTWMRTDTEQENIRVNSALVRNLLNALSAKKSVQHVALVTGLKHYLGPFEAYAKEGNFPETPLREEQPRLELDNFYYAQEDEVYDAAARDGFTWSIHRPHTLIGYAVGNLMNLGTTLAIYASICKEKGVPLVWPGSEAQWSGLSDVTDAQILAEQLLWAATTPKAQNEAFNIVNGDTFRWKWLWQKIADYFEIEVDGFNGSMRPLDERLSVQTETWKKMAAQHNLVESDLNRIASAWHTDLDLGRPIEVMTDMARSRKLGFTGYQSTVESFYDLFDKLREERLIP